MGPMSKITKAIFFMGLGLGILPQAHAEALDGYVGFGGGMIRHLGAADKVAGKDTRYGGRIDFVRLQKSVALDLRGASGLTYQDFGAAFKIFHHFQFSPSNATGISLGGGLGGMYSRSGFEGADESFYEIFTPVFARVLLDFGFGMGIYLDAEYAPMLQRRFTAGATSDNRDIANRYYLGAGVAFGAM